ncbi:membrane protein [Weissella minor]|uniref:Membrane protein n=2 Tax=Weissella minor TaxID=1620 RepID=A0A0R2JIG0_9LACO|nr:membrane protein [Weissella minor]
MMRVDTDKYPEGAEAVDPKRVKHLKLLSKLAMLTCISMYVSYIPQIMSNFNGEPVSVIQPLVATINACLWTSYGWLKTYKDWPIIISNVPGVIFGLVTVITVYIH